MQNPMYFIQHLPFQWRNPDTVFFNWISSACWKKKAQTAEVLVSQAHCLFSVS